MLMGTDGTVLPVNLPGPFTGSSVGVQTICSIISEEPVTLCPLVNGATLYRLHRILFERQGILQLNRQDVKPE